MSQPRQGFLCPGFHAHRCRNFVVVEGTWYDFCQDLERRRRAAVAGAPRYRCSGSPLCRHLVALAGGICPECARALLARQQRYLVNLRGYCSGTIVTPAGGGKEYLRLESGETVYRCDKAGGGCSQWVLIQGALCTDCMKKRLELAAARGDV